MGVGTANSGVREVPVGEDWGSRGLADDRGKGGATAPSDTRIVLALTSE